MAIFGAKRLVVMAYLQTSDIQGLIGLLSNISAFVRAGTEPNVFGATWNREKCESYSFNI